MSKNQSFLKLPFEFDVATLMHDLALVPLDAWTNHPNTKAYSGSWLATSLTSTNGDTKEIVAIENQKYQDTPLLKKTIYIKSVINTFQTKIEAVRFMKLGANSIIKEHTDRGSCFDDGYARIHIPITTNSDVAFILNGIKTKMDIGKCYYIDADAPHSVVNLGHSDRVHLLIDCHINEWMKDIFKKAGFIETAYKYGSKDVTDENIDDIIASFQAMNTEVSLKMAQELEDKKDLNVS
ncbi:MAG: aspartyl/asparaginyl beta-hydroxylase domain-containing protein [Sulfurimonas sp.]|nr:aspartyl/asparaginyl beta-hydroxylase domain-containing protein [Sulfurimonas sp.]